MSISQYTLETLYNNGAIDYVPYDLMMPMPSVQMNANQYMNAASQGNLYANYGANDAFVGNSPALNALGISPQDFDTKQIDEYKKSLRKGSEKNTWVLSNPKQIVKGLVGAGVIMGTLFCLFKGKKKPATPVTGGTTTNLWTKFKSIFKK